MRKLKRLIAVGLAAVSLSAPLVAPVVQPAVAIAATTNGVVKEGTKYIWYENGKKSTKTGVYNLNVDGKTAWRYVKAGEVQTSFTGIAKNEYGTWYLEKGTVTFKKTGNVTYNNKKYYVVDSRVYGEVLDVKKAWYEIHSMIDYNYVIDVHGAEFKNGTENGSGAGNIQLFRSNKTIAQRFFINPLGDGLYNITTGTGDHAKRIDVASGKKGANIRQWESNTGTAQKFRIIKNEKGSVSFINEATKQALDIAGNDNLYDGQNIWDYPYMFGNDKGQNFKLVEVCKQGKMTKNTSKYASGWYWIESSTNSKFRLDVNGNKADDKTKIQLWEKNNSPAQKFYLKNMGNGIYEIYTGSTNKGSAIDAGGANGKIHEWKKVDNNNQKFKMLMYADGTVTFINVATGKAVDVAGGGDYKNGRTIQNYQHIIVDGLRGAEGQTWRLVKTEAPTGWVYNGTKYVDKGTVQKGLQKIANTWYLFNKSSGKKEQSGDKIRVGSFFQAQSNIATRFFVTLDGTNFVHSPNFTTVKGRDMSFIAKDGIFYGVRTAYSNPIGNNGKPYYDFAILATKDFKKYNWHSITDAYVNTARKDRWAPEWFEDSDGQKYVFYSVNKGFGVINKNDATTFTIYRTKATDLKNYKFTKPVEMKFNVFPQYGNYAPHGQDWARGFIDACVVKNGKTYVMFVKDEHQNQGDQARGEAIWVYTSSDLTNWKLWYKIPKKVLPQTPINLNGKSYNRYWEGPNIVKIGNTWHFYADEMLFDRSGYDGGKWMDASRDDMYSGRLIHLTSNDLRNWTNKGYIKTGDKKVRHGSIMTVNDAKSEEVIKATFNK